ncbi:MAG TPA: hypothetical protein VIY86_11235, partial [Pirellulaceae bacterium]
MVRAIGALSIVIAMTWMGPFVVGEQPRGENELPLIPRRAFFEGDPRVNFQANAEGERLYFQIESDRSSIWSIDVAGPKKFHRIEVGGIVEHWRPLSGGLALIVRIDDALSVKSVDHDGQFQEITPDLSIEDARFVPAWSQNQNCAA